MPRRPAPRPTPASPTLRDAAAAGPSDTPLPNERDEGTGSTDGVQSDVVQQGARDIERGLQDTDRGAVADATYRKLKH